MCVPEEKVTKYSAAGRHSGWPGCHADKLASAELRTAVQPQPDVDRCPPILRHHRTLALADADTDLVLIKLTSC